MAEKPRRNRINKSNAFCSVPQCKTYCTQGISMHIFPKNKIIRKKWQIALKIGKRITDTMVVCSKHFRQCDYFGTTRKKLFRGTIPSINLPVFSFQKKKNERRRTREPTPQIVIEEELLQNDCEKSIINNIEEDKLPILENLCDDHEHMDDNYNLQLFAEVAAIQQNLKVDASTQCNFTEERGLIYTLLHNNEKFHTFTGISIELFNIIIQAVENVVEQNNEIQDLTSKVLLLLIKCYLNLSFKVLSVLFNKHATNIKKNFIQILPYVRTALECCIYWPSFEENQKSMPKCFKLYRKTRVVLDCTEIAGQTPTCLKCRCRTYSNYKRCHTVKYLLGVTPAGTISYISPAYGGRASDKAIFTNENFISKLEPFIDHVMVDKGFHIAKELEEVGIKLIRPPFMRKKTRFTKSQVNQSTQIARSRVHVERAIGRFKNFKITQGKLAWHLLPYIDDVTIIICALVNLTSPILKDIRF